MDGRHVFPRQRRRRNLFLVTTAALAVSLSPATNVLGVTTTFTNANNNFFGSAIDDNGTPADPTDDKLIQGELKKPWAGAGGGGGGDAAFIPNNGTFPWTPFNPVGDEKGSATRFDEALNLRGLRLREGGGKKCQNNGRYDNAFGHEYLQGNTLV